MRRSIKDFRRGASGIAVVAGTAACATKTRLGDPRTRRRRSIVVLAAILPCLAAGCGGSTPVASLQITYTDPMGFGPVTYGLRCSPSTGTAPDPTAICAAIASRPALVLSGPGQDHSCPPTPSVGVQGIYGGKPVSVAFSACLAGQGDLIGRWLALLPGSASLDAVRLDRGLGPLTLGQSRIAVQARSGPRSTPPRA